MTNYVEGEVMVFLWVIEFVLVFVGSPSPWIAPFGNDRLHHFSTYGVGDNVQERSCLTLKAWVGFEHEGF